MVITLKAKGQIVLPTQIRKKMGLRAGSKLAVSARNGEIILKPHSADPIEASFGCLAGEPSLVDVLLAERQKELADESGRF